MPSCSDASYAGGGCCIATGLAERGRRRARATKPTQELLSATEFGTLSRFDGVGGARRVFESLKLPVAAFMGVELCERRRRVCRNAWPHMEECINVEHVTESLIKKWAAEYPRLRHLLCVGGFPCTDMSRLKGELPGWSGGRDRWGPPRFSGSTKKFPPRGRYLTILPYYPTWNQ